MAAHSPNAIGSFAMEGDLSALGQYVPFPY